MSDKDRGTVSSKVSNTKKTTTSSRPRSHIVEEDDVPFSYQPFADLESRIIAPVNIFKASSTYEKFTDDREGFNSEICLIKGQKIWKLAVMPYKSLVSPNSSLHGPNNPMSNIFDAAEISKVEKSKLTSNALEFFIRNFFVVFKFQHTEQYTYFFKIFEAVIEILAVRKERKLFHWNKGGKGGNEDDDVLLFNEQESSKKSKKEKMSKRKRRMCVVDPSRVAGPKDDGSSGGKKSGGYSSVSSGSFKSHENRNNSFFLESAENWSVKDYHQWLDCLYLPTQHGPITIFRYLQKKKLLAHFDQFIQNQSEDRNYLHLMNEFKRNKENCAPCLVPILFHKQNRELPKRLLYQLKRLNDNHGIFDPCYSLVLKKRLISKSEVEEKTDNKQKKRGMGVKKRNYLLEIENQLRSRRRYWWNVEECKMHILSILIFHKSLASWIIEKEKAFRMFELDAIRKREEEEARRLIETQNEDVKRRLNEELEGEDDDVRKKKSARKTAAGKKGLFSNVIKGKYSSSIQETRKEIFSRRVRGDLVPLTSKEKVEIDPDFWHAHILEKFNAENNIRIEQLSFKIHIAVQQNNFRFRKKKKKLELEEAERELEELEEDRRKAKEKMGNLSAQIQAFMDVISSKDESENATTSKLKNENMDLALKRVKASQKILESKKKKVSELDKKMLETTERVHKIRKIIQKTLNPYIEECIPERNTDQKEIFLKSSVRQRHIQENLSRELIRQVRRKGMGEFVVKLVLSARKSEDIGGWQAMLMKKIDPIFKPRFFQWGFLHSNVLVANLGIHFFANSLVYLNDLSLGEQYEEIAAIDCYCPFIVDISTINERIEMIAEEVVFSNVNYQYSSYNLFGPTKGEKREEGGEKTVLTMNCQEFTERLINCLGATPFYPIVKRYLEQLKFAVIDNDGKKGPLRWIPLAQTAHDKKLREVMKDVCTGKFRIENNRIYFTTHAEVDEFYNKLSHIKGFHRDFPGVIQLLKAFDRAFWMLHKGDPKNPKYLPLKMNCPLRTFGTGNRF